MPRHPTAPVNVARINVATSGTDFTAPEADFVALIRQSDYPLPRNSLFQIPQIIRSPTTAMPTEWKTLSAISVKTHEGR
jgi:hypothetical protein